jgi:hypothetical protein
MDAIENEQEVEEAGRWPAGLYVTDAEIIRRLGYSEKVGARIIRRLDRGIPTFRKYPQKDPLFADKRFWPEVLKWHLDYHRVSAPEAVFGTKIQPMWQENFNDPAPDKARKPERARPQLATTR